MHAAPKDGGSHQLSGHPRSARKPQARHTLPPHLLIVCGHHWPIGIGHDRLLSQPVSHLESYRVCGYVHSICLQLAEPQCRYSSCELRANHGWSTADPTQAERQGQPSGMGYISHVTLFAFSIAGKKQHGLFSLL